MNLNVLFKNYSDEYRRLIPADSNDYAPLVPFTFSSWFKGKNTNLHHHICGHKNLGFSFSLTPVAKYSHLTANFGIDKLINDVKIENNKWYHLALTWDGQRFRFYIDSILIGIQELDKIIYGDVLDREIWIYKNFTGSSSFQMTVADIGLWDSAFDRSEIANLFLCFDIDFNSSIFFDKVSDPASIIYGTKPPQSILQLVRLSKDDAPCTYVTGPSSSSSSFLFSSKSSLSNSSSSESSNSSSSESTGSSSSESTDSSSSSGDDLAILRIDTSLAIGSGAQQFRLPLELVGNYNFYVNWGDGSPEDLITVWNQTETTHLYSVDGIYDVTIRGLCRGWQFGNGVGGGGPSARGQDRTKVIDILQWGKSLRFGSGALFFTVGEFGFQGCSNLTTISAPDGPCMIDEIWLSGTFWDCAQLATIAHPEAWDMTNVTTTYALFEGASLFNADISIWDMSGLGVNPASAGGLQTTFRNAIAFNQPIGVWDVAYCPNFQNTFFNALAFNQDLSAWNVERGGSFLKTFQQTTAFKQDLGAWWPRSATTFFDFFTLMDVNSPASPIQKVVSPQNFSAWSKTASTIVSDIVLAPDGTLAADRLVPSVANVTDHSVSQDITTTAGLDYTFRCAFKADTYNWGELVLTNGIVANIYVDLSDGSIVSSAGVITPTVTDIGGGWWVLEATGTALPATTKVSLKLKAWDNASGTSFAGDTIKGIYIWQASAFASANVSTDNFSNLLKDWTGWTGTGAGSATRQGVTAAPVVATPGSGYAVGDVLLISGGTVGKGGKTVEAQVATIDGIGGVLTVTLKRGNGNYDTTPINPVATTGGSGVGCTLTLTWVTKYSALPSSMLFSGGNARYSLKDGAAIAARKNLVTVKGWTISSVSEGGII